ncbi:sigma-70 family RNA polymerase sigma factor [Pseudolysinimonas sp.]|uniref:sigma-70 family RNA polymerase sigma factor n=1 Tax=Pseudolysinimonas sp. TaxID=2680009 RepID=UPI00286C7F0A|nr:sigma-70 family RNA polymerase sigma factor [Pseudolysinimonas sp.]
MSDQNAKLTTSDAELIECARSGDTRAFGELWRRHYRSAARVARQFTSSIDADDLVSEAYARIYQRVLAGGGPTGAFRPYLYTTIRNLASSWGAASRDVQVDIIEDCEDDRIPDDPAAWALDRTLTARAFRSLPERWQTVLWYTEVEGMDPHEVAPLMGMTANSVAALSYRAREGLRKAWLQAHVSDAAASGECQWAMSRLGEHARDGLSNRDRERLTAHLVGCAKCAIVSEEVDEVGSHLALVMLPLLLGGVAGGTLLASLSQSSAASAADFPIPDVPVALDTIAGSGVLAAPIVGGLSMGAATGTGTLVGGFAVVAVIVGSVALGVAPTVDASESTAPSATVEQEAAGDSSVEDSDAGSGAGVVDDPLSGDVEAAGGVLGETVDSVIDTITDDGGQIVEADVTLHLTGTGTPGATITAQAAGTVYATAQANASGRYVIEIAAFPGGLSSIELVQTIDRDYLRGVALGINPLAELLGLLDGLIDSLIQPLGLSSGGGTVDVNLVG